MSSTPINTSTITDYGMASREPTLEKGVLSKILKVFTLCLFPKVPLPPPPPTIREQQPIQRNPFYVDLFKEFISCDSATERHNGFWALEKATTSIDSSTNSNPVRLKEKIFYHISTNRKNYAIDGMYYNRKNELVPFDEYLTTLKKPDELAYRALSELYQRPVHVYSPVLPKCVVFGAEYKTPPIYILCTYKRCEALFKRSLTRT